MTPNPGNGMADIPSHQSVDQTVKKLEAILRAKAVTLFALVDHGGEYVVCTMGKIFTYRNRSLLRCIQGVNSARGERFRESCRYPLLLQ